MATERSKLLRMARAKTQPVADATSRSTSQRNRVTFCDLCGAYGEHVTTACPERSKQGCPEALRKPVTDPTYPTAFSRRDVSSGSDAGVGTAKRPRRSDASPANLTNVGNVIVGTNADFDADADADTDADGEDNSSGYGNCHFNRDNNGDGDVNGSSHFAARHDMTQATLVLESAALRLSYCDLPADYLPAAELEVLVSRRPDVPTFLRCAACLVLADDAVWCSCCDVIACKTCVQHTVLCDGRSTGFASSFGTCPVCLQLFGSGDDGRPAAHAVAAVRAMIRAWKLATMEAVDKYGAMSSVASVASAATGAYP